MAIVVVGGHTRNIGKTGLVAGLVAAMPEARWTAIKITQYGHGVCSANGEDCDCATADHAVAVSEERDGASGTDTARYLAAGAKRSIWVRTRQGDLHEAMPAIRRLLEKAEGHVLIESNSILRFLRPDLALSVLDPAVPDFKPSALRYLDRVDAVLVPEGRTLAAAEAAWPGVSARLLESRRCFRFKPPVYAPPELVEFVREQLERRSAVVEAG